MSLRSTIAAASAAACMLFASVPNAQVTSGSVTKYLRYVQF